MRGALKGVAKNMSNTKHETDVSFIKALAELLRDNDLTELQVKRKYGEGDSLNVRVSRQQPIVATAPVSVTPTAPITSTPAAVSATAATSAEVDDPANHPGAVTSPMVGTVYLQAEPGTPPFVSVGAQISEGDTILIVEAMKTMNHIPAPTSGIIKRILVGDGDTVEYGAPLVIIE